MNKKIYAAPGATDNLKIIRGYRVTSCRRMIVNNGRISVHLISYFGNSYFCLRMNL